MTEPPQPPNQPPAPSGYGHLPGPPQQGYGYPQGENPYAQQAPYAQQPPTVQQQPPGHAYPPPPGMPTVPVAPAVAGGPGMPPKKKRTVLIAASAAAAVLAVAVIGYVGFAGSDEDPKPPVAQESTDAKPSGSPSVDQGDGNGNGTGEQADLNSGRKQGEDKVLWLKTAKVDGPGMGVESAGQWVVGDTVVKSVWKSLSGYAVTDGKEKWTLPFPAPVCSVARGTTPEGKTAVMYRDGEGRTPPARSCAWSTSRPARRSGRRRCPRKGSSTSSPAPPWP